MCSFEKKKQPVKIAFYPGGFISVDEETNQLIETGDFHISNSMIVSGTYSMIPFNWEILKPFINNNNVEPVWVGDYSGDEFDPETGEPTGGLLHKVDTINSNRLH